MYYACQDHLAFWFWHRVWHALLLFGERTHTGNGTFQACVCLQYTGKIYCSNTLHDCWRYNNLHFLARGALLGTHHRLTEALVGRDLWKFNLQFKAELLPALGQVSHASSSWVFEIHSKDGDSITTLISLSNCLPNSSLKTQSVAIASSATGQLPLPRNIRLFSLCNTPFHSCRLLFDHLLTSSSSQRPQHLLQIMSFMP